MKTELFCFLFKKNCDHNYRFLIVFAHCNALSVWKTLQYSHCAGSSELDAYAFQYISPQNWRGIEGMVSIFMTSPFSDSIVFFVHTRKQRFQKASFSNRSTLGSVFDGFVFGDRFRRCSVDDSRIRSKTAPFPFESGLVWTGP